MSRQLETFPCRIKSYQPFPRQATAYANGVAVGEDELPYLVKGIGAPGTIAANEFVFTSLADLLNLPVAPHKVLQTPNGDLVFGTQILSNALSDVEQAGLLFATSPRNDLVVSGIRSVLSQLYAFDLFIGNTDRHSGNYLFTVDSQTDDVRTARLRAIDFDSATLLSKSTVDVPMHPKSNTVTTYRLVRQRHTFDSTAASDMLSRLRRGRAVMFERALLGLPREWLSDNERGKLMTRVSSDEFGSEIAQLEQGLANGTYL